MALDVCPLLVSLCVVNLIEMFLQGSSRTGSPLAVILVGVGIFHTVMTIPNPQYVPPTNRTLPGKRYGVSPVSPAHLFSFSASINQYSISPCSPSCSQVVDFLCLSFS
ncbi:hypothetical protein BDV37DRAFT_248311 [Aspergillus pseudonomiae]|uniref:Uncharacterized protein n=1 Tax=Aspergillus pseudonomiae TaxID=1506151 RepID=A0A5N7DCM1_9EURO|nr:uncharacterized protein BDV37DRAFT_248311 [Aspergillus pseudonomiae]KAE8404152.1 hypothetical protein BDV37DRAFT_248311 [Aspergillus pseudonomiae]